MLHQKPQRYIYQPSSCAVLFLFIFSFGRVHFSRKIVFTIMNLKESGACMVNRRVTAQTLLCAHWFVCLLLQQFNCLIHFMFTKKHCIPSAAVVPLQSRNSEFTGCCVHLLYILNASFVSMCAPCKNAACMCVSAFTSDWICWRVFFVSLHFIMLLICSNDWYSSLSLLFLLHRRNFHVDCFQYYIFFHPFCLYFF